MPRAGVHDGGFDELPVEVVTERDLDAVTVFQRACQVTEERGKPSTQCGVSARGMSPHGSPKGEFTAVRSTEVA